MFRTVPRTQGVSTTDLVGRMLLLSREHHKGKKEVHPQLVREHSASPFTRVSHFVPSSHKIVQFSEGQPERTPTDKVV